MSSEDERTLKGWKAIAGYLGCSVKTAQRWELKGLPVRRHQVVGVIAYKSELDVWVKRLEENSSAAQQSQEIATSAESGREPVKPPPPHWRRIAAIATIGVALAAVLLTTRGLGRKPSLTHSLAVLDFRNQSGAEEARWLGTALAETYRSELGASPRLRAISGEDVARMTREVSLPPADSFSKATLRRIHNNLGADWLLVGMYAPSGAAADRLIRIQVTVQDTRTGETVASDTETGTELAIFDLAARAGSLLRARLGVGEPRDKQLLASRNVLPKNLESQRLYVQGLRQLRLADPQGAADVLTRAIGIEPAFAMAHEALARAWTALGYEGRAADEARLAYDDSDALSPEEATLIEGTYRELSKSWDQAISLYQKLWGFGPDNLEYALLLAHAQISAGKGKEGLETLARVEKQRLSPGNPGIDLTRTLAAESLGDFKLEQTASRRAATQAAAQGALLLRAQALLRLCWASYNLGQMEEGLKTAQEARGIFVAMKERAGEAQAVKNMADIVDDQGRHEEGRNLYNEALAIFREVGYQTGVAATLNGLAYALEDQGDLSGAGRLFEESVDVCRRIADKGREALALNGVGIVLWRQGDLSGANRFFEEALAIHRQRGDKSRQATLLNNLALVLEDGGQLDAAERRLSESLEVLREVGDQSGIARNLGNIGELMLEKGDPRGARKNFEPQLAIGRTIREPKQEAYALQGLGEVALAQGDLTSARQQLEKARAMRSSLGEKGLAAESQLALAGVALEDRQPSKALEQAREAAQEFRQENETELAAQGYAVMAEAQLAQRNLKSAQQALDLAGPLLARTSDVRVQLQLALSRARVAAAVGMTAEATKVFQHVRNEAIQHQYADYALEARLGLAEMERNMPGSTFRTDLTAIENEARSKGLNLIALKAAHLR